MLGIFASAGSSKEVTFIGSAVGTSGGGGSNSIVIPSTALSGDYVVLFQQIASGLSTPGLVSQFTNIIVNQGGASVGITGRMSYKKIGSGDIGSTLSLTNTQISTLLVFRPSFTATGQAIGTPQGVTSSADPGAISVTGPSTVTNPHIIIGHYGSTGTVANRTSSVAMTEVNGQTSSQFVKYKVYNQGTTAETVSIDTGDNGSYNLLQLTYLQIS